MGDEGVIFGSEDDDEAEADQQGLDDEENFVGLDEVDEDEVSEEEPEGNEESEEEVTDEVSEEQEEDNDMTDSSNDSRLTQEQKQKVEEESTEKLETLGACHGGNISIMVRRENERDGSTQDNWFHFHSELSDHSKEEMKDRVEKLQQNKDAWDGPIELTLINTGTMDDPEVRYLDFEIPDSSNVPDDWEPVLEDDDDLSGEGQSSSSSDSDEEIKLSDYQFDDAMKKLENYSEGDYSVDTEIVKLGISSSESNVVKATVEIHGGKGEGSYTGHATDEDSTMNSQLLEVAETRAVKRAIKNSGVLLSGDDE